MRKGASSLQLGAIVVIVLGLVAAVVFFQLLGAGNEALGQQEDALISFFQTARSMLPC